MEILSSGQNLLQIGQNAEKCVVQGMFRAPKMCHDEVNAASSSRKTRILLANLFDYTLSPEEGLEFYWPGSKKNLEADLLEHEHALADELSDST